MNDLQIIIPCGSNSARYLEFLVDSIIKTTFNFKLLIGVKNNCLNESVISKIKSKVENVKFVNVDCRFPASSEGHGFMLDKLCEHLDSQYGCFIDCDCALLHRGWFEILSKHLKDDVICIGSEYDGGKYLNFPNVVFCLFRPDVFKSLSISFLPRRKKFIVSEKDSNIFSRGVGEEIFLDVGWEFPYKSTTSGHKGIPLPLISPRRKDRLDMLKFMTPDMRGEEHQIDGIPIVTHVGRSSSRSFDDPIVQKWRDRVLFWLDQK